MLVRDLLQPVLKHTLLAVPHAGHFHSLSGGKSAGDRAAGLQHSACSQRLQLLHLMLGTSSRHTSHTPQGLPWTTSVAWMGTQALLMEHAPLLLQMPSVGPLPAAAAVSSAASEVWLLLLPLAPLGCSSALCRARAAICKWSSWYVLPILVILSSSSSLLSSRPSSSATVAATSFALQ